MREKVVVLKIADGSFEQGFSVTLQLWETGDRPSTEITGRLPPAPQMPLYYHHWQTSYRSLGMRARLSAPKVQITNVSHVEDCQNSAQILRARFNTWLAAEEFRSIREKWLEQLQPKDGIRVLLQTSDPDLQRLPWHLWDLLDRYPKAELALSAPVYERVQPLPLHPGIKILAILGNSDGIDTQVDRELLDRLPDATVEVLTSPTRKELTDRLWGDAWDLLFFAGHSATQGSGATGRMFINQSDSLTISELKYALRKAVERGLRLAIFNSCDGLGLARELADLHIPQVIVMREPVPDRVAQEFLQYFLTEYAQGESFYRAVRQARERLQGLEDQFPCATWLPVIYQNPAETPLTWTELAGQPTVASISPPAQPARRIWRGLAGTIATSFALTGLVMGARYAGVLQPIELQAFDQLMRSRPPEHPDPRLLLVTITEADVQAQPAEQRRGSLSDKALNQLLTKLEPLQPRVIGLDIYRDYPVQRNLPELARRMQNNDRFVAVCKVSNPATNYPGIAPPQEVSVDRLGFADLDPDPDNVVRRHLLAMTPAPADACATPYAFSLQLALRYLAAAGIDSEVTPDGMWRLGNLRFSLLDRHSGGYHSIDLWGHQILLNYRASRSLSEFADRVTLEQVLAGQLNANAVKDRIVIIGTTAESFKDYLPTPYTTGQGTLKELPGVMIQAQMVSQLVSAAIERRPLLSTWSLSVEALWIWGWSLVGGLLAYALRRLPMLALAIGSSVLVLYTVCLGLLIQFGWWVPLVPAAIALSLCAASIAAYRVAQLRPRSTVVLAKEGL
jgi:CHASE2 domain-containing sensor protein